jgi:LSD1 subclass zinc finger protein
MSQSFQCSHCGAPLEYNGGDAITVVCSHCSSTNIVPEDLVKAWQVMRAAPKTGPTTPTQDTPPIQPETLLERGTLREQLHEMRQQARGERRTLRRQVRQLRRQG